MGVWIEIVLVESGGRIRQRVTPFMGVWIEILAERRGEIMGNCHTLYGCVD